MIRPGTFRTRAARRKARRRLLLAWVGILCGIAALLCLLAWGLNHPSLRLAAIEVRTDGVLEPEKLEQLVRDALAGTYLGVMPRDTALYVPTQALIRHLEREVPRIAVVTAQRQAFRTLSIAVTERTQHAWWCGDVVPEVPQHSTSTIVYGKCYAVDREGYLFALSDTPPHGSSSRVYYGSLAHAEPIGQSLLPLEEFTHLESLYRALGTTMDDSYAMLLTDERDVELYRMNRSRIIIPRSIEVSTLQQRLDALTASDTIDPERELAYIDLRYAPKVFIRYHDEVAEVAVPHESATTTHTQDQL